MEHMFHPFFYSVCFFSGSVCFLLVRKNLQLIFMAIDAYKSMKVLLILIFSSRYQ